MRIAIVHDWLVTVAGSERVLEQIVNLYPDAEIYSLVDFLPKMERTIIRQKIVKTSIIQKFPLVRKYYRNCLPLFPFAVEQLDISSYDLVISSSHAIAKGILTNSNQLHICYCHTPIRYAWDFYHQYLKEAGLDKGIKGFIAKVVLHYIRIWDESTVNRVDFFIANSNYIAKRIKKTYARYADVIYPPVDIGKFSLYNKKEDYYLTASRMVPYKKIGMIVEAFSSLPDKRLIVIGDGPDLRKVKSMARKNVELLGYQPFEVLKDYLQRAKAFVFAAEEDFGILPVEAQACGTPVIAFGRGGVTETVVPLNLDDNRSNDESNVAPTGVFFYDQTADELKRAVNVFEQNYEKFDGQKIRENAIRFSIERFQQEFKAFVDARVAERRL